MFKRFQAALVCSVLAVSALASCGTQKTVSTNDKTAATTTAASSDKNNSSEVMNFTAPVKGEKIVTINIKDYGAVKIKLFPEYAEKGVENFIGLAEKDYYKDVIFHRVIDNFMIQGGDPLGTGMGGECIWGSKFDGGTDSHLIHCAGALAYANSGSTATNGSQFYIVTGSKYSASDMLQMGVSTSEEAMKLYETIGGAPWLDGGYTVFGQVFDGLDIIFEIQKVAVDQRTNKPMKDVVIESVVVSEYNGEPIKWYLSDYEDKTTTEASTEETAEASSEENTSEEGSSEETSEEAAESSEASEETSETSAE